HEPGLALGARRRAQPAVESVRPGVVGTLESLARALAACHDVAPVAAHVEERPQLAVARPRHHHGDLAGDGREERALLGDLAEVADVLPGAREDPLPLSAQDLGIRVPGPGKS